MKKTIAVLLCLALSLALLPGCAAAPAPEETQLIPVETPAAPEETAAPAETEAVASPEPTEEPAPEETRGHYRFQPKVCSSYMTELFGEAMTESWFSLVDAVMAGEDTFACPDEDTYWWVMGQYPDRFFPVLQELIYYTYDVQEPVKDGVASFTYTVPKEEASARIAEFASLVEDILNETLRDTDTDLEKALALYLYFSHHYVYDYEAADPNVYADYLSSYRVLTTGTGICQEFSVAYSYLLLQAGVDATTVSGHRIWDDASHQWSFVKINGQYFHVDPTYVVSDQDSLSYFMMTDERREQMDGYPRAGYTFCSHYAQDHPHPDYAADDDSFREIWRGRFTELDRETHVLRYTFYDESSAEQSASFDYTGW